MILTPTRWAMLVIALDGLRRGGPCGCRAEQVEQRAARNLDESIEEQFEAEEAALAVP
jgi:hypothetical protein